MHKHIGRMRSWGILEVAPRRSGLTNRRRLCVRRRHRQFMYRDGCLPRGIATLGYATIVARRGSVDLAVFSPRKKP